MLKFNSVWTALCSWVLRKHCHILRYSSSQTFSQFKAQKTNLMTSRSRVGPYIINLAQQNIGPFQYWICPPFSKSKIVFHVWSKPGNSCVSCPSLSPTWRTWFKLCHVWTLGSNYKLSPTLHLITIRLTSISLIFKIFSFQNVTKSCIKWCKKNIAVERSSQPIN